MTPHKPDLHVIIGLGKPKAAPPPFPGRGASAAPLQGSPAPDEDSREATGQKATPEEAQSFSVAEGCANCDNFIPDQGACKVVAGQWDETKGCRTYFEPKGTESQEGPPDNQGAQVNQPTGPETQEGAV